MNDILDQITLEDLPEDWREIAETIGFENYRMMVKSFGGTYVYFPKLKSITARLTHEKIANEFDGANYKELAVKYNLSEIRIRTIINEQREQMGHPKRPIGKPSLKKG